jgi:hypothetical protein
MNSSRPCIAPRCGGGVVFLRLRHSPTFTAVTVVDATPASTSGDSSRGRALSSTQASGSDEKPHPATNRRLSFPWIHAWGLWSMSSTDGTAGRHSEHRDSECPLGAEESAPYRPAARKLMRLAKEDVSLGEMAQMLRTDAAFSADLLRLANSPLFGMRCETQSELHAVAIQGFDRVKALATIPGLRSFLTSGVPNDTLHACWRHNLASCSGGPRGTPAALLATN